MLTNAHLFFPFLLILSQWVTDKASAKDVIIFLK